MGIDMENFFTYILIDVYILICDYEYLKKYLGCYNNELLRDNLVLRESLHFFK